MKHVWLFLILLLSTQLVACKTPKFKVGDCFYEQFEELKKWETPSIVVVHKVTKLNKRSYSVKSLYINTPSEWGNEKDFVWNDYYFKIECEYNNLKWTK